MENKSWKTKKKKEVVKMGIRFLFLILEETFSAFHHCVWCYIWVSHVWPLLYWNIFPLYQLSWTFLSWVNAEFCQMPFLDLLKWMCDFYPFFLTWSITLIVLWLLNNPCIAGINPTWSWYIILLAYCWIPFANFVEDFCIYVNQGYWPIILFFVFFSGFIMMVMPPS